MSDTPYKAKDYFVPPHGGRPPSDEAVRKATERYRQEERDGVGIFARPGPRR